MLVLDAIIRYSTVTLLLMFAYLVLRDSTKDRISVLGALTSVSVAALLLGTPHPDLTLPFFPRLIIRFLDVPSVVLIWWFGRSLFEDDFRLGAFEWIVMVTFVIVVGYFRIVEMGFLETELWRLPELISASSVILMLHLIWISLTGRSDDVIEDRRKFRLFFALGMGAITIVTVVAERLFWQSHALQLNTFRAGIILPFIIFALQWVLRYLPESLSFQTVSLVKTKNVALETQDRDLRERLLTEIEVNQAYIEHGLTISSLANRLGTTEHRLRALINQGMQFRNFSGFLNQYRISAVQNAMQMDKNQSTPILTLALEHGFSSLAPFNRAFKTVTGMTPTEYRNQLAQLSKK